MSASDARPDLRMVPVALASVVVAAVATGGHRVWTVGLVGACLLVAVGLRRRRSVALTLLVAAVVATAGGAREWAMHGVGIARLAADRAVVTARVVVTGECRVLAARGFRPELTLLPVRTARVSGRGTVIRQSAPLMASSSGGHELCQVSVGQVVDLSGRLAPSEADDPQAGRLTVRGPPRVVAGPNHLDRGVNRVRRALVAAVAHDRAEQRALVPSLVVGDTSAVPESVTEDFKATSLTHLTAVSGANLASTTALLWWVGSWLGWRRPWLQVVSVLGVVGFVLVCRAEPSVVRAAAMGLVTLAATGVSFDRSAGVRALCVAVSALMLVDPWLSRSVGLWLSVSATAGILWWTPPWARAMSWAGDGPARALVVPWAAQLATQPVVTWLSGSVSMTGLVANMVAAPFVGPATILGMTAAIAASLWTPLGVPAGWLAGWCVQPVLWIAHAGARAPAGLLTWPAGPLGLVVLAGICLGLAWMTPAVLSRRWSTLVALVVVVAAAVVRMPVPGWPGPWSVIVCDVGQGSATLIRAGPHSAVLVDTGPEPGPLRTCLSDAGVRELPLVVLSHYHADHIGGLDAVLGLRTTHLVLVSDLDSPAHEARRIAARGRAAGAVVRHVAPGEVLRVGEARVEVVDSPLVGVEEEGNGESSTENNSSVLVRATSGSVKALVTGDIEPLGQQSAHRRHPDLAADLIVMPHHGSSRQDREFWAATGARLAISSAGIDNPYGHPAPKALRLAAELSMTVHRTDREGSLSVGRGASGLVVRGAGRR